MEQHGSILERVAELVGKGKMRPLLDQATKQLTRTFFWSRVRYSRLLPLGPWLAAM